MIGGIERNPKPAADKGSPYKGDLALPGRTSTGCNEAPGAIVESDWPLNLLPSLDVSVSLEVFFFMQFSSMSHPSPGLNRRLCKHGISAGRDACEHSTVLVSSG